MVFRKVCTGSVILVCLLATALVGQPNENRSATSLRIDPTYLDMKIGQVYKFSAQPEGLPASAVIVWLVVEKHGAKIAQDGVFTASKAGVYHVIAAATVDGSTLKHAVAKVAVSRQDESPATVAKMLPFQ